MSERRQFIRSNKHHDSKRSNFANWDAMNSNIPEIDDDFSDKELGKYEKRSSKSLTRASSGQRKCNPELSKQMKRSSESLNTENVEEMVEGLKKQVKELGKKLNKARNEKSKALHDLVKERERSKRFENDAIFWREESYKKQESDHLVAPKKGKDHEEVVDKLASLFFTQTKLACDILSKEMKYDRYLTFPKSKA